jgi:hypothetical protein
MQREMAQKGIKREEISPAHAVLYGATAGYAVCRSHIILHPLITNTLSFLYYSSGRSYIL